MGLCQSYSVFTESELEIYQVCKHMQSRVLVLHGVSYFQKITKLTSAEILQYVNNFFFMMPCVLYNYHSAYRKFHEIDPLAFSEDKKGRISFVTVADSLPQLKVSGTMYVASCYN